MKLLSFIIKRAIYFILVNRLPFEISVAKYETSLFLPERLFVYSKLSYLDILLGQVHRHFLNQLQIYRANE